MSDVGCIGPNLKVKCVGGFNNGFRSGLENVIFLWAELHKWREKNLVLLISQKDYEHI